MLKLKNVDESIEFFCNLIGYQFPESEDDDWCLLSVSVHQKQESCELIDPALETTELIMLLRWFSSLSEGRLPRYSHLTFTEPCISFEFLAFKDSIVRIGIHLSHELKPNFSMYQFCEYSDDWCIIFELDYSSLVNIANNIRSVLERYPVRGS